MTRTLRRLRWRLALALLLSAFFSTRALAHRLDEYLQATIVVIEPGGIRLQMNLTPGVQVAETILAQIDRDHSGIISDAEAVAYAESLKRDLTLQLDQQDAEMTLSASEFPDLVELRAGVGIIQMEFSVKPAAPSTEVHKLTLENRHLPKISDYLFNAAKPKSTSVRILTQKRNQNQSLCTIEFMVEEPVAGDASSVSEGKGATRADGNGSE